jgi:hypothetical protein
VAFVLGDNLFEEMKEVQKNGLPPHLDSGNSSVTVADRTLDLVENGDKPIVSANVYLGAREIVKGLEEGADIIIAGRVADASPVSVQRTWLYFPSIIYVAGRGCSLVLALMARYRLQ